MLFNSFQFLVFFPVVVILYFSIPHRFRWALLLGASYYFYMCWKPEYVFLIVASTLIDYYAGIQMGKQPDKSKRKKYLILSLLTNLGLLFSFKYFNFFNDSLNVIFAHYNIFYNVPAFKVLLPVGISFYTFQTLSYSIDVYRGERKAERHLGIFALYVAFFPQLVAGPIERSGRLLPQFYQKHNFDYDRLTSGLRLMLWGFFKKIVIADRIAVYVNQVYNNAGDYQGVPIILATYLFAVQIFCDFSGYSDIAIGGARVMGFDLMENFRRPYFAQSIREFWKRWHISLTTWFKDYLYISLGGSRVGKWQWYYNLLVVFLISGLWHGANWTFVIWGALHGLYLLFSIWTKDSRKRIVGLLRLNQFPLLLRILRTLITFHLVCFAWIFFRANSLSDAFLLVKNLFVIDWARVGLSSNILGFDKLQWVLIAGSILLLEIGHIVQKRPQVQNYFFKMPTWFRWTGYYSFILFVIFFGAYDSQEFIYFQF